MNNSYKVQGYIIVQGVSIPIVQDILHNCDEDYALRNIKFRLKKAFENTGTTIEFTNCIFEKDKCAGLYVNVEFLRRTDNIFKRIWKKWPLKWK